VIEGLSKEKIRKCKENWKKEQEKNAETVDMARRAIFNAQITKRN